MCNHLLFVISWYTIKIMLKLVLNTNQSILLVQCISSLSQLKIHWINCYQGKPNLIFLPFFKKKILILVCKIFTKDQKWSQFEYGDNQRRDVLTTLHMVVNTMNFGILILSKEILILRFKILNGRNLHFYDQKIHN